MKILTIKTDQPNAEIALYDGSRLISSESWLAHRQLSDTLLMKIDQLLQGLSLKKEEVEGIVVYQGPGSFTGLRIGLTVANALSYSWSIPIVGSKTKEWIKSGIKRLVSGENEKQVLPFYGADPHVTRPKK